MLDKNSWEYYFVVIAITILLIWICLGVNRFFFKKMQKKRIYLHLVFFEKMSRFLIVLVGTGVGLSFFGGIDSVWKSILGGTAIISAVLVFIAQDTVKDILAGMMISAYKPFEIGNRIELETGEIGIVKDITMRHVVIHTWGVQELIIPNSKLNTMMIKNDSYHTSIRSYQALFHIGYGSDVKKAMEIIKQIIVDSPYTCEGKLPNGEKGYSDVYFLEYRDSSLLMGTTVYYKEAATEVVRSDINLRVNEALKANGIEIPYAYVNVIQK
ncbi:MAG: mechanosensitive ion channel [Solobacterium sp.]|nr:mechanosensitive ion channel [Solobacterium sp.]